MDFCCDDLDKMHASANDLRDKIRYLIRAIDYGQMDTEELEAVRRYKKTLDKRIRELKDLCEQATLSLVTAKPVPDIEEED